MAFIYNYLDSLYVLGAVLSHENDTPSIQDSEQVANSFFGSASPIIWIAVYAVIIVFLFIVPSRTRKKKELEIQKMHEEIKVGDSVILSGGLYGKIVDIYPDLYVVEFGLNKGIRIPINKGDVIQVKEPNLKNEPKTTEN